MLNPVIYSSNSSKIEVSNNLNNYTVLTFDTLYSSILINTGSFTISINGSLFNIDKYNLKDRVFISIIKNTGSFYNNFKAFKIQLKFLFKYFKYLNKNFKTLSLIIITEEAYKGQRYSKRYKLRRFKRLKVNIYILIIIKTKIKEYIIYYTSKSVIKVKSKKIFLLKLYITQSFTGRKYRSDLPSKCNKLISFKKTLFNIPNFNLLLGQLMALHRPYSITLTKG
ncbi:hypothetical protein B0T21DRAFT_349427 [Apiosordaria backusii]|uniref:Uncharacterized protein n=1 Tax=Apiosordaria backusii TaxID=314023 RepID=A0AA40BDW8_9PEZI|nr:hypothetical protein B0T21DRAFT_349427 [Apiosordaria backusii]